MVLSGGRIASLDEGTSDVERGRKGVHPLHYFGVVCDVDLILRVNLVAHPHTLIQNFCGIKINRQTGDDSASVANQVPASLPSSPLSAWFSLMDLEVAGDGVDRVQEKAHFRCSPIWSPDEASLDSLEGPRLAICLVRRHTPRSEGNDEPFEPLQGADRFDSLDTEVVELQELLAMVDKGPE